MGPELSYYSQKHTEILAKGIVRYSLKNDMENNSVIQTVTVTVRKFRNFQMAAHSFLYCNAISIVKNPE